MADITYDFVPFHQPTNTTCTQTATAMLVSHYDPTVSLEAVCDEAPTVKIDDVDHGTSMQRLAVWCLERGYTVDLYSSDAIILDMAWGNLSSDEIAQQLNHIRPLRKVATLAPEMTLHHIDNYSNFLQKGGHLQIRPVIDTALIDELLQEGPVCVGASHPALHHTETSQASPEEAGEKNGLTTHAVLVYGKEGENYLIADPWEEAIAYSLPREQLTGAIMAAQWACDNVIFCIRK